jgi:diguanylate cyclase (GGDEF)-like protein/PAS domain S-box-containing protein
MNAIPKPSENSKSELPNGLARYEILDTAPETAFDDLTRRAAEALETPMAGLSFFDRAGFNPNAADTRDQAEQSPNTTPREWFKSRINFPFATLALEQSFFRHYLRQYDAGAMLGSTYTSKTFVIADTLADKRVRDSLLVTHPPHICFYAAAPIFSRSKELIGVLAVFDVAARDATPRQLEALGNLADLAGARLEARAVARHDRRLVRPLHPEVYASEVEATRLPQKNDASDDASDDASEPLSAEFLRLEDLLESEIEQRHAIEAKLVAEKEFSDAAIRSVPGAFFMFDRDARMVRWNQSFQDTVGYTAAELVEMHALDFIASHDRASVAGEMRRIFDDNKDVTIEALMRLKTGVEIPYLFHGRAVTIGGKRYCIGVGRDISERKRAEHEIRAAKERLDLALVGSSLAMWDWDLTNNMVYFNKGWATLLGAPEQESVVNGEQVLAWTFKDDQEKMRAALELAIKGENNEFNCEYRVPDIDGNWMWLHTRGAITERDANRHARRMTGTSSNITKRKLAEERAEYLATRDPLTGLPNRMLVNDRLEQGIAKAARKNGQLAFMFIDLDRFKTINDSLGHDVGDELLKRVAARLSACVRSSDTVARLGGDEFAVILENLQSNDQEGAQNVAEKMIASLASPIMINNQHLNTSCSIGIGLYPDDGNDPQTLMKHADVAMYDAKAKGRNNYQFFSHEMNTKAQERLAVENYLRLALRRNELVVYYQPRISFKTGKLTGMEALIRWNHPRHGLVLPGKFISVAEDAGLIVPIGEWVMETAFAQLAEWQKKTTLDLRLAVNLSVGQMLDGERLMRAVQSTAKAVNLDTSSLELELTESMLLKNSEDTAKLLMRLGDLGIHIAIDDFGTGYSSLSYLKQLPVDTIKVDSSFVRDIGTDPNDEAIIRAIIAMTHSLKLNVVAEGVEREDQYRVLRDLDCDEYQGFLCSPALPAAEFEAKFLVAK